MEPVVNFIDLIPMDHLSTKAWPGLGPDSGLSGRFLLGPSLGQGAMCQVFEAIDQSRAQWGDAQPKVAIKKLLPEFQENPQARLALAQEFFKARDLLHPNVVRVYDLHQQDGQLMFTMELLSGQTLRDYLSARSPRPIDKLKAAAHLFQALAHIHQKGLAHADLKPGNLFLCPGRTVIFDFNLSVVWPAGQEKASSPIQALLKAKSLPGYTMAYASLERLQGARPSLADDIFAASLTAYELLTGNHPFSRLPADQAQQKGLSPKRPAQLARRPWKYLLAGLSLKPDQRPQASELSRVF